MKDYQYVLALPMEDNDANAKTIGEYLVMLLAALWDRGESFSGKRPFGNSGWKYDLYIPLVRARLVKGSFIDDYLDEFDILAAQKLISETIQFLLKGSNHE